MKEWRFGAKLKVNYNLGNPNKKGTILGTYYWYLLRIVTRAVAIPTKFSTGVAPK
jgi:hypothetical protein